MNRVVHFEIQADDLERAAAFYRQIFGWKIEKWGHMDYWMVMTAEMDSKEPGINGGMLKRPAGRAQEKCGANAFVCTVQVSNFDQTAEAILAAGGQVAMPKFSLGEGIWQGYFLDTEGNTFGVHEYNGPAKTEVPAG